MYYETKCITCTMKLNCMFYMYMYFTCTLYYETKCFTCTMKSNVLHVL